MKPVEIPRRIDDPIHALLWSLDELLPISIGMVVGVMLGKAAICTLIGFGITNLYKRFRDNHPDGYMFHSLYWFGVMGGSRSMINPYIRRLYP
ncbi:type IV conjugative transfer system protein TraL [Photobacterium ganghwense]|uniref:type IV conjugative transfer system protein TraL n=1 Tax=Photobacterium ganghwense TaxID=320778 RepID=UPI001A8D7DF0|nr:type IV conjugative transfer system protein TraL [Photobacterium ganghwense]QSV17592.1 type IV conjugative transfer system protein TraL [Photobacterium ganghwense]